MDIKGSFTTSLTKALTDIDPGWQEYNGLIVAGTHSPNELDIEKMLEAIKEARESNKPFLGICFGFQLMLIEYARNVRKLQEANTTELNEDTPWPVFTQLAETRTGAFPVTMNGTKRLESHWHNYAFNQQYISWFKDDFQLIWTDHVLEAALYKHADYFRGVQYHPEYESSQEKPHPILKEFIRVCKSV